VLLAALCWSRQAEITDALVELLVALVHKINARAERRVEKQLTAELKKVRGKEGILFKLATAAVDKPDEVVRRALFPVVGEKTLRELVAEAKANEKVFKAKVRTTLRSSYNSYCRQMLPPLLNTLGFRCDNTAYRPVMDAMKLLKKYADVDGKTRFYDATDVVPMDGVVRKDWREAVVDDKGRVERIPYELCVLVALRDAVRRREIYVEGTARWCNPEDDLPGDFEATRTVHYAAIRQPLNPRAFIADQKKRMTAALDQLSAALADGSAGGVKVTTRKGEPWITVPKLEPLDEPTGLQALKDEVVRRWGVLDLLDVLKNSDFLTGFTEEFSSVAAYERIDRDILQRRPLLALFALGTNMGIRAIVATGEHGEQRRDDLLARRAEERLHLLPAQVLFVLRGRGDDRGAAAALHGRRDRVPVRRHARRERGRVRLHRAAELPPAAAAEEHRQHPPVPPGRLPARLAGARCLADAADPLGADRAAVRPDAPARSASVCTGLLGAVGRQALRQSEPRELVVVERGDLGDRPAGNAQDVDRQRQVRALGLLPEVEGQGGLPVHRGGNGAQAGHALEAALDQEVHHCVAADVQAGRGRHREADVVPQHRGERLDVRGHAGLGVAAHQLTHGGVLLSAGPVLPLRGQVLPHPGPGALQRAVHGVDGVAEEFRDVLRRPAEHVPQDQHGPRARREVLDRDQVRQLDRLPRDGDGLRLVRVTRGQFVEQPVRVGLQPPRLAAGRGLGAALGEQVQAGVGGDPVEPGPERRPPLEGLPPPPGT
jgi:hypothetical protein